MKLPLTYISLFSSAGVGCYGFKLSGFKCIATNELIEKRLEIQKFNKTCDFDSGYILGDITHNEIKNKLYNELDHWKSNFKIKEPDIILATPPCQGMSVANHKKNNEKSRNSLVVESISITKEILPKFFVYENVRSFLTTICTDLNNNDVSIKEAIENELSGRYNILSKIVNLKEYGSQSSRTRTLVIGVRKDIPNISPFDLFPRKKKAKNLKSLIGNLEPLNKMGQISNDIYHFYRSFDKRMLPWIENLKEGESAFDNKDPKRIPHRVIDGKIIYNQKKNGDKYSRCMWGSVAPCIHTRNDILASQKTIHPNDNRVFSIREIMRMMSIPKSFKWSSLSEKKLNDLPLAEKEKFLKKEELNIRKCLGEAVPTMVFKNIADNIHNIIDYNRLKKSDVIKLKEKYKLEKTKNLINFIKKNFHLYSLNEIFLISELSNADRQKTAAYFTRSDIVYSVIKDLPDFKNKKNIRIIEPSVGVGNFLPQIFSKYSNLKRVDLDVCDIDENSLEILKTILSLIKIPKCFNIRFYNQDFLELNNGTKYDLAIGNPPFGKITANKNLLLKYKQGSLNKKTNNLFAFFVEKCMRISSNISLIVPKSILNSPEFDMTRKVLSSNNIMRICDYGEYAFKGVKIETISFQCRNREKSNDIVVESYINKTFKKHNKEYIFSEKFPYWIIYRNNEFDKVYRKLNLGVFKSFRDRQITKKITSKKGVFRVLKARNIANNKIVDLDDYDTYINNLEKLAVSKFLNKPEIVMIPNLTYYPRGCFLPKNSIADGSVALLETLGSYKPSKKDLEYYGSNEFESYYRIARNFGTRSLNIDNNSVYFFGILKKHQ